MTGMPSEGFGIKEGFAPASIDWTDAEAAEIKKTLAADGCRHMEKDVIINDARMAQQMSDLKEEGISFPVNYGRFLAGQYAYIRKINPKAELKCMENVKGFDGRNTGFTLKIPGQRKTGFVFGIEDSDLFLQATVRGDKTQNCYETGCDILLIHYLATGSTSGYQGLMGMGIR
ncbi:MAG: hypothetical protein ACI4PW_07765 [Alphaproteobacteria bacterium]